MKNKGVANTAFAAVAPAAHFNHTSPNANKLVFGFGAKVIIVGVKVVKIRFMLFHPVQVDIWCHTQRLYY
ncbi:MAG: hypothetical protein H0U27_07355 [Nitrosopumilus sp.]|nr:hypothetical protein [Nitrosopumilus sp.]